MRYRAKVAFQIRVVYRLLAVWPGRFKAFPIQADEHLLAVLRYVEQNPLRAKAVARAEN